RRGFKIKILILTLADKNFFDVAEISTPNKMAYANRHGYEFFEEVYCPDVMRYPSWNKILLVQKWMECGWCDWIFWTDADSLIMNQSIKLEDIIKESGDRDLIIASDKNG